jgi:hypothetical protein
MRKKFNLIGNTFTHLTGGNLGYSVHGKISKFIEWVTIPQEELPTFYMDDYIDTVIYNDWGSPKYAWLLESKWITPAIDKMKNNPSFYLEYFDLIFTHDQELISIDPKFKFVPAQGSWIKEPPNFDKTKLVSMITSNKTFCAGHIERLKWLERLRPHVDLYGRGFNPLETKEPGLQPYMFSVAIENGSYSTYFTEKILDCFMCGTIPVYIGAPDIGDFFDIDGIIILDEYFDIRDLTSDLYLSKKDAIVENYNRSLEMEILEDYIWCNYFQI